MATIDSPVCTTFSEGFTQRPDGSRAQQPSDDPAGAALTSRTATPATGGACASARHEPGLHGEAVDAGLWDESAAKTVACLRDETGDYAIRRTADLHCWGRRLNHAGLHETFELEPSHLIDLCRYRLEGRPLRADGRAPDDGSLHTVARRVLDAANEPVPPGSTMLTRVVTFNHPLLVDVALELYGDGQARMKRADGETALSLAVKTGVSAKIIARLAQAGADFQWVDEAQMSLLAWAYYVNWHHLLGALQHHGATWDVGACSELVERACANRKWKVLERLFCDRNVPASCLMTAPDVASPLHRAVEHGRPGLVRKLITKWVDLNPCNAFGDTPLQVAISMNDEESTALLLAAGAEYGAAYLAKRNSAPYASGYVTESMRPILQRYRGSGPHGPDQASQPTRHQESFVLAADSRRARRSAEVVDPPAGYVARVSSATGSFDLVRRGEVFWAVRNGEVCDLTLQDLAATYRYANELGAAASNPLMLKIARDALGWLRHAPVVGGHLLMEAAVRNHAGLTELVMAADGLTDAYVCSAHGHCALSLAVCAGSADVLRIMIEAGAELTWRDPKSRLGLLAWATYEGHTAVMRQLERAGASLTTQDRRDLMSLGLAERNAMFLARFLEDLDDPAISFKGGTLLPALAADRHLRTVVQLLIQRHSDVNARDSDGRTALMLAAGQGLYETVCRLLRAGANATWVDRAGKTALDHAMANRALVSAALIRDRIETDRAVAFHFADACAEVVRTKAGRVEEAARVEEARVEAERVAEAARVEAVRLEAARLEAAHLEAARLEAERLEAARLEDARLEAARIQAAQLDAARVNRVPVPAPRTSRVAQPEPAAKGWWAWLTGWGS